MKAELEPPGTYQGIILVAETQEEEKAFREIWLGKARIVCYWDHVKMTLAPTCGELAEGDA